MSGFWSLKCGSRANAAKVQLIGEQATDWSALSCTAHARGAITARIPTMISLCLLKTEGSFYAESGRLAAITTDILEDTGAVISATPFPAGSYRERTGLMHELRKDGLDL